MKKYKISVYAISKNEEKFVDRWYESMKEADEIYVLDTGSTDKTVKKLKEKGINVKSKKYDEFRFDVARNDSLNLVSEDTDICVCTDLDEVLEPGWREKIEKIHKRKGYKWYHPVHEILVPQNILENIITTDSITLNHYPDKEKSRGSYLPLLELSVKEDPQDDRNMHYLGREYMYYGKWNDCIDTLIKHLNLKNATWKDERSASMRFIARSYKNLKRYDEAKLWLDKAIKESPYLRDPYVERAILDYELEDYISVIYYCNKALEIKHHEKTYINEVFSWDSTIYDLLSISYYNYGKLEQALFYINEALKLNPKNIRLNNNKKFFLECMVI